MTLWVDFNMQDQYGRIPVFDEGSEPFSIQVEQTLLVEDGEGTRAKGIVKAVDKKKRIAYITLLGT